MSLTFVELVEMRVCLERPTLHTSRFAIFEIPRKGSES